MTTLQALTDFLLARIAEDEAEWSDVLADGRWVRIALRQLAECESKRRIVELAEDATGLDTLNDHEFRVDHLDGPRTEPYCGDLILMALTMPYIAHPDYREEWAA